MNENKTIAINTIVLTIKLVVTIVLGFVVSRLILQALGADNYGLYNVVGGIVAILNVVATSMIATSYRYIAVEIGKGASGDPQKVYSTLFLIHLLLACILFLVGLPIGRFYINNYLNVTSATIDDAQYIYIFSLIAAFFSVIAVPSNGLLVANEKFIPTSIIEIFRSILNVLAAVLLLYYLGNRLRLYALLMAAINVTYSLSFHFYCKYKYSHIVRFKINRNIRDYKEIASFTWWMLLGATAVIGRAQGLAMVINLFFKNSINAAFGIANQIGHATTMFTSTLRQSVTPQIMKNQESNATRSLSLVYAISRCTYLIMLIISVPLLLCIDTVLEIWLGSENIPPLTAVFSIFLIINGLIAGLSAGFDASIQASGKVRKNQIGYTIINLSIIPIVYILFKIGFPEYMSVVVGVILTVVTVFFQAYIMQELTDFNYKDYCFKTILPSLYATVIAFLPMYGLHFLVGDGTSSVICFAIVALLWTCISVFMFGFSKQERNSILAFVNNKIHR